MKLKWITHACIQIITNEDRIIYVDPYQLSGNFEKADIALITHDHFDHLSVNDINKVAQVNTSIVIPENCSISGNYKVVRLSIGDSIVINGIKIEAVPSYTPKLQTHPKENNWHGYIINVDGKRIYHAGDTGKIPEMSNLKNIDVACIPVGGKYTMGMEEAAESVKLIMPEIVVPIHNWDAPLEPFKDMIDKDNPSVKTEILIDKLLEL